MIFLTRLFGVTGSDAERDLGAELACIKAIVEKVLLLQANAAGEQRRPLGRGTSCIRKYDRNSGCATGATCHFGTARPMW